MGSMGHQSNINYTSPTTLIVFSEDIYNELLIDWYATDIIDDTHQDAFFGEDEEVINSNPKEVNTTGSLEDGWIPIYYTELPSNHLQYVQLPSNMFLQHPQSLHPMTDSMEEDLME